LKVRDVTKLNKAFNNVYFGDLRLFANVAKFDRFVKEEERMEDVVGRDQRSSGEGEKNGEMKVEKKMREIDVERVGNRKLELEKVKEAAIRSEEERERELVVKVGEIECSRRKEKGGPKVGGGKVKGVLKVEEVVGKEFDSGTDAGMKVMCKFMPFKDDITWVSKSILARLKNSYCLSVVQQSFVDMGFVDFKLISLGGDNVVLHPCVVGDVMELFKAAADFIGSLDDCRPWTLDSIVIYERGAWVRCYGVPLHVWNNIFFLELATTQGRLLKIDDCTINKDRLDFARFLTSTCFQRN